MRLPSIFAVFILTVFFGSCQRNTTASGTGKTPNLIMQMEKTSCYGDCPVYVVNLYANGEIILDARDNMEWIGKYKTYLSGWQMRKLRKEFDKSGFFDFEDSYESLASDLPTTYLYYTKGKKEKTIKIYDQEPEELDQLVNYVEELINELQWKRMVTDL